MKEFNFNFNPLRGKIREIFFTEAKLADVIEMDKSSLSVKLNNKVPFSPNEIVNIMNALQLPLTDIHLYFFNIQH